MDADGLQDETPPLDCFRGEDSSSLSESVPSGLHPTVVSPLFVHRLVQMASMAQFATDVSDRSRAEDDSDDSI